MSLDVHGTHSQTVTSAPRRYPTFRSITLLAWLSVALMSSFVDSGNFVLAATTSSPKTPVPTATALTQDLPALGNTPAADRLMLREISDQHVFDSGQLAAKTLKTRVKHILDTQTARNLSQTQSTQPSFISTETLKSVGKKAALFVQKPAPISNAWQFVQQSTRLSIPDNEQIRNYREQYLREAMWISKILNRASPFVGHIVEELDKRYLPVELALLPAIESGYQPDVHSAENAAGIWQIVPATAKEIGLKRTQWFDGRADIAASTTAAIDYLSYLNAEFHGDWLLTLAAYNAGPGRVRSSIKRNEQNSLPTDFWSLRLPKETRQYVPKFLALVALLRYEKTPELEIPTIKRGKGFELVDVGQRVSLDKVAELSLISEKALRLLNASLVHAITPPSGPHTLNVPLGQGAALLESLSKTGNQRVYSLPATHTVVAGESLSSIAKRYGISQRRLRSMNALDSSLIKIGQQLAIRDNSMGADNIEYMVTIGDTLSEIAHRFSVRIDDIRDAQGEELASDVIHPGVRLSIVVDTTDSS